VEIVAVKIVVLDVIGLVKGHVAILVLDSAKVAVEILANWAVLTIAKEAV
jgi:hypothetical protein